MTDGGARGGADPSDLTNGPGGGGADDDGTVEFYGWIFLFQLFNQKMRASLWKKYSFKGFVKKAHEKRTFFPQHRFF